MLVIENFVCEPMLIAGVSIVKFNSLEVLDEASSLVFGEGEP